MRVLVTGGLGFLGHGVTGRLVELGHQPVALTSRAGSRSRIRRVESIHADIRDGERLASIVRDVAPDGVCHLAALTRVRDSFESPLQYFDVNVGGTIALLEALATLAPVPIVFASTGAVYGRCDGRISEDHPTRPTNPYGASKLAAEELLTAQAKAGAAGVVVLRCFNVAGAVGEVGDPDTTRIIPKALAVAAGRASRLSINGDGRAVREFTHVADVADAVALALQSATIGEARVYNVGSGVGSSMLDVVAAAKAVTGRRIPVEHLPPKEEPTVLIADSCRIEGELGWLPQLSALDRIVQDAWTVARG